MTTHGPGTSTELGETPPRVLLYTKPGCHLCDDARAVVDAVCAELGEQYDEVDITSSPALTARYGEEIPVTLVDGVQHDYWRVDPDRLRPRSPAPETPVSRSADPVSRPAAGRLYHTWSRPFHVGHVTSAPARYRSVCSHVHKLLK